MKKKIFASTLLCFGLLLCAAITCFAESTAESVIEAMAEQRGQEKYLESVHAPTDNTEDNDHIDMSTGNVVLSEADLYLPGKNGLDLTLSRRFNTNDTDYDYEYRPDYTVDALGNMVMYKYRKDTGTEVWVAFVTEEEFLEAPTIIEYEKSSAEVYDLYCQETSTVSGYYYSQLTSTDADGTLTLITPVICHACWVSEYDGSALLTHWEWGYGEREIINYNWYFNAPYTDTTTISSRSVVNSDGIEFFDKTYLKLFDGSSQVDLRYHMIYQKVDGVWQISELSIHKKYFGANNYKMRVMTAEEEALVQQKVGDKVSLWLCVVLEREDGLRYFLNRADVTCDIILVADRFGNCIDYSTEGEIIDSMGRRIVYSPDGIQMEDENGDLQYVVKYTAEEVADPENPSVYYYKTYFFKVERFAQLGDTQTDDVTMYKMRKRARDLPDRKWVAFYYTIESIIYPTGAHRDYTYDKFTIREPYYSSVITDKYIDKHKAVSSKLYAANNTDYEYYYEYAYDKPDEGRYSRNDIKAERFYTTVKTRKAPDSADDIVTTYTYDYLSRIHSAVSKKGTEIIYPGYEYDYGSTYSPEDQPRQIDTEIETNVVMTDKYAYAYNESIPSRVTTKGLTTEYIYDYSDSDSVASYFLPTSIIYTPEGGETTVKTVTNTLTEDKKNIAYSTVSDANGVVEKTEYEYHSDGTVSKIRVYSDITNNVYTETSYAYTYNTDGSYSVAASVLNVKDADGANGHTVSATTAYDRFGNVISTTDGKGTKTEYTYDLSGRVLSAKTLNPAGTQLAVKTYVHDVVDNTVDVTRENGRQEKHIFDSYGNLIKEQVNYNGGFKTVYEYTYDTYGRPVSITEVARYADDGTVEEQYTTTYTYDDANRVVKETTTNMAEKVVREISTEYGASAGVAYAMQWLSNNLTYANAKYKSEYDVKGYKIADVILNGTMEYSRTDYTYDCFGNVLTIKDDYARTSGAAFTMQYTYDHAGRVLTETDAYGATAINTYDNAGNLITTQEVTGGTINYSYDELGRNSITYDGAMYVKNYYDDAGNLVKTTDKSTATGNSGHVITYTYDDFYRMTKKFNSTSLTDLNSTTGLYEVYTYDIMGNVLSVSQNENGVNATTYTYDILGRMLSMTDAENNTETYTYNFDGTLKTKTDKKGTVFTYSGYNVFKNAGRIDAVNGDESQYQEFRYDAMNNLTYEYDSEGLEPVGYAYDFLGRMVERYKNDFGVLTYTYDTASNRTSMVLGEWTPMGTIDCYSTQTYTYDLKGRMATTTAFNKTAAYEYNGKNQVTSKDLGTIQTNRIRNSKGLVTEDDIVKKLSDSESQGLYYSSYEYNYRSDLNREYALGTMIHHNLYYSYDGANRLTSMDGIDRSTMESFAIRYSYDERGNLLQYKNTYYPLEEGYSDYIETYSYRPNDHIFGTSQIMETGKETVTRAYQSDINGNRTVSGDGQAEYDLFNRLISYTKDGLTTTYTYFANGLRESKTVNGVTTTFVWDGGNLSAEVITDIYEYTHVYVYGADGLLYRRDANGSIYTYNTNYRGDVLSLMDENQTVMAEYMFDAYGNAIVSYHVSGFSDNFGYRGEYQDLCSGLIYLRNRYYDPSIGRFISEDPARDGLNWYVYCENNPVNRIDPLGLESYVFYTTGKNSDFSSQAQWQKDRLENMGEKVIMIPVTDVKTFEDGWNGMGMVDGKSVDINYVMIYTHGNHRSMIFESGSSTKAMSINGKNSSGRKIGNVNDLQEKEIKELNLLSCNAGNLLTYYNEKENLASVLSKKVINGNTYAYDGNVSFGKSPWDIFGKDIGKSSRLATNQHGFNEIAKKYNVSGRKPLGKITYYNGEYKPYGYYPNTSIWAN